MQPLGKKKMQVRLCKCFQCIGDNPKDGKGRGREKRLAKKEIDAQRLT